MQVELIEANSMVHTDQIGNVLQPTFASRQPTSNDNCLVWSQGSARFLSGTLDIPEVSQSMNAFEQSHASHSSSSLLDETQFSLREVLDVSGSHNHSSTNRSGRSNNTVGHGSAFCQVSSNVRQAGVEDGRIPAVDDFIELDLCWRPLQPLTGDFSGPELSSTQGSQIQLARAIGTISFADETQALTVEQRTIDQACQSFPVVSSAFSISQPRSHSFANPNPQSPHPSADGVRERTRHKRSSSAFPGVHAQQSNRPAVSENDFGLRSSHSPSSFCLSLQSSESSPPSLYVHRLSINTSSPSTDRLNDCSASVRRDTITPSRDLTENLSVETRSLMLLPIKDLASGGSLTCTVVNILKGLRLLDRCGLEDLCASLYGLRSIESNPTSTHLSLLQKSVDWCPVLVNPSMSHTPSTNLDCSVIRSASFTSAALVSPRRSTVPRDYGQMENVSSHTVYNENVLKCDTTQNNCVVNYILACSRFGATLPPFPNQLRSRSRSSGTNTVPSCPTVPSYLPGADWRRGRASNLVNLLTSNVACSPKSPRTTVNRLVAGRFLMGPYAWRSVWPSSFGAITVGKGTTTRNSSLTEELIRWITAWIHSGAVIVLAQQAFSSSESRASTELLWCHRVICGVSTNNSIYLSNPAELVRADDILFELSHHTTLRLAKSALIELWADHQSYADPSISSPFGTAARKCITTTSGFSELVSESPRLTVRKTGLINSVDAVQEDVIDDRLCEDDVDETDGSEDDVQSGIKLTSSSTIPHPHQACVGDFSLLACQPDPRWNQMNVLGQVLQTIRGLDIVAANDGRLRASTSGTAGKFFFEQASLSSSIVIPCSESPGFSVFVPKMNWELVHSLFAPSFNHLYR